MISYEVYKVIHLASIISFMALATAGLFTKETGKSVKILTGITSFLILVAGMGLLARIGVSHGEGFPTWVIIKMILWLILAVATPVLTKRMKDKAGKISTGIFILILAAVIIAVYKPF